jgi:hypothetical protein
LTLLQKGVYTFSMKYIITETQNRIIKENDLLIKSLEKALFGDETPTIFNKGEEVVVKTTFFPKKEYNGIILSKTSTSYKVLLNDNMKTIKNFSSSSLESRKDKPGFKYKLFKK